MRKLMLRRKPARTTRSIQNPGQAPAMRENMAEILGYPVQTKLKIGAPDDAHEREADSIAERVMAMPEGQVQRKCADCAKDDEEKTPPPEGKNKDEEIQRKANAGEGVATADASTITASRSNGQPLPNSERTFFEGRFGRDLGAVNIHADAKAERLAGALSARAFTVGREVYFGRDEYRPNSQEGRRLLAHELAHVLQQRGNSPLVQRRIELRPPGRGEASAFDRAQELVDRLNGLTQALHYKLEGQVLSYEVMDESLLNEFDRRMRALIDQSAVLPMRLITGAGYVRDNPGGPYGPIVHDTWTSGYVDLDDLMASDNLGFKTQLVHFLTERNATSNYANRIGTNTFTLAEFDRVHQRGYEAEVAVLRDEIGDPSLRYLRSEEKPTGTWRVIYRSDEGYRIVKVFRNFAREIVPAETYAIGRDGKRMTIAELVAYRQARATPPPAPAAPAAR